MAKSPLGLFAGRILKMKKNVSGGQYQHISGENWA